MNIQAEKLSLISKLLGTQNESVLKRIKAIFEGEEDSTDLPFFSEKELKELNERKKLYKEGKTKGYSLKEFSKRLQK